MTVGQIFTKFDNFIENRQIFTQLNCNCTMLANSEDFKTCLGGPFFHGHSVYHKVHIWCYLTKFCTLVWSSTALFNYQGQIWCGRLHP